MSIFVVRESSEGVPVGAYTGEFFNYEVLPPMPERKEMGEAVRWQWRIVGGEYAGRTVQRITGREATTKNACGKILGGLTGKPVGGGDQVDVSKLVGHRYTLMVQSTQSGGTFVDSLAPLN